MGGKAVERAGRLGVGLNPLAPSWEALEDAIGAFRDAASAAGHDPSSLPVVVRANSAVGGTVPEGERQPLSGSPEQAAGDLERLYGLAVNEMFFVMNRFGIPIEEQFGALEEIRSLAS